METLTVIDKSKGPRQAKIVHVGRNIPKVLRNAGYMEVSAMHLGRGIWAFRLERDVST